MSTLVLSHRKTSLWGVIAVVTAAAAGLVVYSYLSWLRAQVPVAGKLVPMVVARLDLAAGTVLQPDMLETVDHPSKYLPANAIGSTKQAEGKVLSVPLYKGEPVTDRKLGFSGGLSSVVPTGMRAYSLSVASGSSLGFLPRPGDRVDVIVTFPPEVLGEATAMTVLRHKQIASVGHEGAGASGKVADQLGLDASQSRGLSVTLFVSPEEAQRLAVAESFGKVTVVLAPVRSSDDPVPAPVGPAGVQAH